MKFIYLSTLCTKGEYKSIIERYGTISSHASQKFNRLLLYGLRENGIDVETVSFRPIKTPKKDDLDHKDELENGIHFSYLPHYRINKLNRLFTIFFTISALLKITKKEPDCVIGVDAINGELSIAAVLFSLLRRNTRTCAIVTDIPTIRANDCRKGFRKLPIHLKTALISQYHSYVFLTENMNIVLNRKNKPYVVIEGICDNSNLPTANSLCNKHSEQVVMLAGMLEKAFGVEKLVRVFHKINNDNARLHIYGKGKSEIIIREYEMIDRRIHFFGEVSNEVIVQEECKATLLVNPRPPDGEWTKYSFPSKNMEYICSGTPLLAYWLPCIPDEYRGHFVEIQDKDFQTVLESWLNKDASCVNSFGLDCRDWIIREKNPKRQTERMTKMLKGLIN